MCKFLSAIVKRDGKVVYHPVTDSHEDLVAFCGLSDKGLDYFVRVEYTSDNLHDLSTYKLRVDEESTPEWFEDHREMVVKYLSDKLKGMLITGRREILLGGVWIIDGGEVGMLKGGRVVILRNSTVREVLAGGTVQKVWAGGKIVDDRREKGGSK